jgi:gas vesicle protein
MSFLKGVGMGIVAGSLISMVVMPRKSGSKKTIGKYLRNVGDIIENVTDAMGI